MNHSFSKSNFHDYCVVCKKDAIAHSDEAICEACNNIGPCNLVNDILMCIDCETAEMNTRMNIIEKKDIVYTDKSNVFEKVLSNARQTDLSVEYKADLFNAATVSIQALKDAIDADGSIENKHYKLAEVLKERFEHFQSVIFAENQIIMDAANNQKAIQVYLNNLANKLRFEEREKLKLADITYQVKPVGPVKTPRINKPTKKFNAADIKKYAAELTKELGLPIPEYMLQTIAVSNNCDAESASNILRRNIKESLSMNKS